MSSVELAHGSSTSTMPAQPFRASRFPDVHHFWGMPRNSLEETKRNLKEITWGLGFPCGSAGKESACSVRDLGSTPGLGRYPGKGKGYPLQYSGLENSMNCIVRGVAKSQTRLSHFHFHLCEVWSFLCSFNLFFHRPPNQNFCFSDHIMY